MNAEWPPKYRIGNGDEGSKARLLEPKEMKQAKIEQMSEMKRIEWEVK